jgi:DNA polymerase-3 subunit gamma/tau
MYESSIKILSDKYSEEEIQILYQIGVSNLKDLEFAPDFKSGFEMAMIRILLFTPFDLEKLQSIKNVGHNLAKENKIKKEEFSKEVAPEKKKINNDSLTIEKNWAIIVKRLEIDSMTKNLANNISFDSQKNNSLNFFITKDLMGVVTERSIEKLQEALSGFLKKKITINISASDSKLPTLHKKKEEESNIELSEANNKMENDSFIKTIKEKFNATSIDNSIKINKQIKGD